MAVFCGVAAVLDAELGAAVQAAQTCVAGGLLPDRHAAAVEGDRMRGAALRAQSAAYARASVHGKVLGFRRGGQKCGAIGFGDGARQAVSALVACDVADNLLDAALEFGVGRAVGLRDFLCVREVEYRRPRVRHLHAERCGELDALGGKQLFGVARGHARERAVSGDGIDIRAGCGGDGGVGDELRHRLADLEEVDGKDEAEPLVCADGDRLAALLGELLDRDGAVMRRRGNPLGNVCAVSRGAEVDDYLWLLVVALLGMTFDDTRRRDKRRQDEKPRVISSRIVDVAKR